MIHPLHAINIQGIDVVINRYQNALEAKLSDWNIYPRLELIDEEWRYYTGLGEEHKTVDFSEDRNTIGFGVNDIEYLGNQSKCDLSVIVSTQKVGNTRDIQSIQAEIMNVLNCTQQTTRCVITGIENSKENRNKQPSIDFTITIEANFISTYKI